MPNVATPRDKFQLRCEARALLWRLGDFDLHTAVDVLESLRVELELGADDAQLMMARAFSAVRDDLGGWVVP